MLGGLCVGGSARLGVLPSDTACLLGWSICFCARRCYILHWRTMQQHPQHGKPQESARERREGRTLEPVPPFGTGSKGANFMCACFALVATHPGSHDMHVIYMELQDVTTATTPD